MKSVFFTIALSAFALPAFAGSQGLSFAELREACQNPAKFQNQIAPSNLQISCEERVSSWVPYAGNEMQMPRSRQVTASLTSDKYQVSPAVRPMGVAVQKALCPNFKEILEISSFTKATTCDELLSLKQSEFEFCADILERARHANPKMVQIRDTGRTMEFCPSKGEQEQKPGKDKGQRK